ncbi:unnamed protein product [Closterium sp. Naga37s-1]|nr:unnamed protein product [Closterium sp. Naga37s-1]
MLLAPGHAQHPAMPAAAAAGAATAAGSAGAGDGAGRVGFPAYQPHQVPGQQPDFGGSLPTSTHSPALPTRTVRITARASPQGPGEGGREQGGQRTVVPVTLFPGQPGYADVRAVQGHGGGRVEAAEYGRVVHVDMTDRVMHGVYVARGKGGCALVKDAWQGRFPWQVGACEGRGCVCEMGKIGGQRVVRFEVEEEFPALKEAEFKAAIRDNVYKHHKYSFTLTDQQVSTLIALFRRNSKQQQVSVFNRIVFPGENVKKATKMEEGKVEAVTSPRRKSGKKEGGSVKEGGAAGKAEESKGLAGEAKRNAAEGGEKEVEGKDGERDDDGVNKGEDGYEGAKSKREEGEGDENVQDAGGVSGEVGVGDGEKVSMEGMAGAEGTSRM